MAFDMLMSIDILKNAMECSPSIAWRALPRTRSAAASMWSTAMALRPLSTPYIGYSAAAKVAQENSRTGRPIRDIVLDMGILTPAELEGYSIRWR